MEIPKGGVQTKNLLWEAYGYFLESHITSVRVKGEGHSRNGVFFEIANKKITVS